MKTLLTILFPPYAVCRYGCISTCALPIASFWLGGLFLLGYYVTEGHQITNDVIRLGSLLVGLSLIGLSILWAQTTIARVRERNCKDGQRGILCQAVSPARKTSPDDYDDPLAEVERARDL